MRILYTFKNRWPPEAVFIYKGYYYYKYFDRIFDGIQQGVHITDPVPIKSFRIIRTNLPVTKDFLNAHM